MPTQSFAGISAGQSLPAFSANWTQTVGAFKGSADAAGVLAPNTALDSLARYNADSPGPGQRSRVTYPSGQADTYAAFIGPACRMGATQNGYEAIADTVTDQIFLNQVGTSFIAAFGATVSGNDVRGKTLELFFFPGGSLCWVLRLDGAHIGSGQAPSSGAFTSGGYGLGGFNTGEGAYIDSWTGEPWSLPVQQTLLTVDFSAMSNGALAAPDWTQVFPANGNLRVLSGECLPAAINSEQGARHSMSIAGAQWARVTINGTPADSKFWDAGVHWAGSGATNRGYRFGGDDAEWFLQRLDANSVTQLRIGAWSLADGDTIEIWHFEDPEFGWQVLGLHNGIVVAQADDGTYTDGEVMLESFLDSALNVGGVLFEAGGFEGGLSLPVVMHHRRQQGMS